jgi:hypothetical protein
LIASLNVRQNRSLKLDLRQLPVTYTTKGSMGAGIGLILLGVACVGMSTWILVEIFSMGNINVAAINVPLAFASIGTIIFLVGLNEPFRTTTITIDRLRVSYASMSRFRSKQWMEDIDKFEGIFSREEYHRGGKNRRSYTLYIVELFHNDSKKTIRLFQSTSSQNVRAIGEEFCRNLNLPALEKNGSYIVKRNVEDLGKSVRDLVKDGKLRIDFDPSRPPPKGLQAEVAGDMFQVIVNDDGFTIFRVIVPLLIPIVFIFIGLGKQEPMPLVGGTVIGLTMVMSILWSVFTRESVKIGEETIVLNRTTPWGETAGTVIVTSDIKSVVVGESGRSKQVLIKTDQQQFALGSGLSAEAQKWLSSCIMSIIST